MVSEVGKSWKSMSCYSLGTSLEVCEPVLIAVLDGVVVGVAEPVGADKQVDVVASVPPTRRALSV